MKVALNVPDELIERLDAQFKKAGYASRSDMIIDAIRLRTHENFKVYVTQRGELTPPNWKEERDNYVVKGENPQGPPLSQSDTPKETPHPTYKPYAPLEPNSIGPGTTLDKTWPESWGTVYNHWCEVNLAHPFQKGVKMDTNCISLDTVEGVPLLHKNVLLKDVFSCLNCTKMLIQAYSNTSLVSGDPTQK